MPFYRKPRNFTPLCMISEKKSIKNNVHHSIFTSRFDKFVGDWRNDLKHGKGFFLTIGGKLYEGDWYNGFRHGNGTLSNRLSNGTFCLEYRGDWVKGKPEGVGWRYYKNGDVYFGFWKKGYRHGYGKMWYSDGTLYVGYWHMGVKEGLGMFVQVNGNRYEGNWKNDKKNGLGRFYHMSTGQLQEGCWLDNLCVKSKMLDINVRQFCIRPTEYPIPPETLQNSREILEESKLWLSQILGDIDKKLKNCID
ncbi:PREDICTED: MORN repeat-containing protein 3-like [Papilio xuthus]|uniref:MORN repeat-containing protein 3 n=1 Tax=Papilio xuthus TaxID=66420 RepID=A0AAJ6ZWQ4_PAPXU|nr:PREDICTED: MORN repeat-containing protein 3-like [Papilio xuthus]